jgi:hypothetical protein
MGDKRSTFTDILYQRCPRCRSGSIFRASIFRGFPRMNERCPVCNLKFEREQGYFLGAMYISYGLALVMITLFHSWLVGGDRLVDYQRNDLGRRAVSSVRADDHAVLACALDLSGPND